MKRDNLRKIEYFDGTNRNVPTTHYITKNKVTGYFHKWFSGTDYERGKVQFALVESEDGKMITLLISDFRFID